MDLGKLGLGWGVGRNDPLSAAGLTYSDLAYDWVKVAILFSIANTMVHLNTLGPASLPSVSQCPAFLRRCTLTLASTTGSVSMHMTTLVGSALQRSESWRPLWPHLPSPLCGHICHHHSVSYDIVYLWSCLNCLGLNFELWVQKLAE